MNPSEQKRVDELIRDEVERDEIGEFVRECKGLKIDDIFKKAGFEVVEIADVNPAAQGAINKNREKYFDLDVRKWERRGEKIYADNALKGKFFAVQTKMLGSKRNWFYVFWKNKEEGFTAEGLDKNPDLGKIASVVAGKKFEKGQKEANPHHLIGQAIDVGGWKKAQEHLGDPVVEKSDTKPKAEKAVEETRKKAKKNFRPWEKK